MYLFCERCNKYVSQNHRIDVHKERPFGAPLVDNTPGIAFDALNEKVF